MSESIYELGKATLLKDHSGNIILPRTTTGLVTNSNGETIDELLFGIPSKEQLTNAIITFNDIENRVMSLNTNFNDFKNKSDAFHIQISEAVGTLRGILEYNVDLPMKNMTDLLFNTTEVNAALKEIDNKIALINGNIDAINAKNIAQDIEIENIRERLTSVSNNQVEMEDRMNQKYNEIKEEMEELNKNMNELKERMNNNVTPISALRTVIELYELFTALHQDKLQPVSEYVIDIYYTLYKMGEVSLGEMPEHIQDLIHSLILKDELNF